MLQIPKAGKMSDCNHFDQMVLVAAYEFRAMYDYKLWGMLFESVFMTVSGLVHFHAEEQKVGV